MHDSMTATKSIAWSIGTGEDPEAFTVEVEQVIQFSDGVFTGINLPQDEDLHLCVLRRKNWNCLVVDLPSHVTEAQMLPFVPDLIRAANIWPPKKGENWVERIEFYQARWS